MSGYASTGRLWNEMAPQPSNSRAVANTTNLLLSAKSTRARIIVFCSRARTLALQSLSQYVVQYQRVRDYLLAWLDPGLDFFETHVVRQEVSTHHLHATKLLAGRGNEHKIAIVHAQDSGCRDNGVHHRGLTAESGLHEHSQSHDSGILDFHSDLGRTNIRIERGADVAYPSLEHAIRIRIQADLRGIAEPDSGQVVLVHVADNPNRREIGNREGARSIESLHGCCVGDL